jgi:ferredoxin
VSSWLAAVIDGSDPVPSPDCSQTKMVALGVVSIGRKRMTHVVTDNCVGCRFTDCVLVCPVDCFYQLDNQVVIDAEECIDCSACVAECPVEAIYAQDDVPEASAGAADFNASRAMEAKDRGEDPIISNTGALPGAAARKAELGF